VFFVNESLISSQVTSDKIKQFKSEAIQKITQKQSRILLQNKTSQENQKIANILKNKEAMINASLSQCSVGPESMGSGSKTNFDLINPRANKNYINKGSEYSGTEDHTSKMKLKIFKKSEMERWVTVSNNHPASLSPTSQQDMSKRNKKNLNLHLPGGKNLQQHRGSATSGISDSQEFFSERLKYSDHFDKSYQGNVNNSGNFTVPNLYSHGGKATGLKP
jgi:hypothetical protein